MPANPLHALVILTDIEGAERGLDDVAVGTTRASRRTGAECAEGLPGLRR